MASKRKGSLTGFAASSALAAATAAKGGKPHAETTATEKKPVNLGRNTGRDKTTAITLSADHRALLRAVATKRAVDDDGRNSVSAVIGALIDDNRAALEREAGPFLKEYRGKS